MDPLPAHCIRAGHGSACLSKAWNFFGPVLPDLGTFRSAGDGLQLGEAGAGDFVGESFQYSGLTTRARATGRRRWRGTSPDVLQRRTAVAGQMRFEILIARAAIGGVVVHVEAVQAGGPEQRSAAESLPPL